MTEPLLTQVDPDDRAAVEAWHAVYDASLRHGRDPLAATIWTIDEIHADLQKASTRTWNEAWSVLVDGEVVAVGTLNGSNQDNLQQAEVFVGTRPDLRGRGYGVELLSRLESIARARGRRLLDVEIAWRRDADPMGAGVHDVSCAQRRGYRLGLVDIQRQLPLPVADDLLHRLGVETATHCRGYTLQSWTGRVPDNLLPGWVELSSSLMTEAPTGEMEREPATVDLEHHREGEALVARQGRSKINTVALTAAGAVVAYTDIALTVHEPEKAYQWGTLVRGDHRGHRLGMAVKLANLRLLQEHVLAKGLDVRRLITWNAEVNAHMIGVNEQLGFVPVERMGEFQKRLW